MNLAITFTAAFVASVLTSMVTRALIRRGERREFRKRAELIRRDHEAWRLELAAALRTKPTTGITELWRRSILTVAGGKR